MIPTQIIQSIQQCSSTFRWRISAQKALKLLPCTVCGFRRRMKNPMWTSAHLHWKESSWEWIRHWLGYLPGSSQRRHSSSLWNPNELSLIRYKQSWLNLLLRYHWFLLSILYVCKSSQPSTGSVAVWPLVICGLVYLPSLPIPSPNISDYCQLLLEEQYAQLPLSMDRTVYDQRGCLSAASILYMLHCTEQMWSIVLTAGPRSSREFLLAGDWGLWRLDVTTNVSAQWTQTLMW